MVVPVCHTEVNHGSYPLWPVTRHYPSVLNQNAWAIAHACQVQAPWGDASKGFKLLCNPSTTNSMAGRNISNLRYADHTTLMAGSEEELKISLMRVKEESAKSTFKKWRSWHSVPSLQGKQKGKRWKQWKIFSSKDPKSMWMVTAAMKLEDACSFDGRLWQT